MPVGLEPIAVIAALQRQIDDRLAMLLSHDAAHAPVVSEAMRYSVLAPGKRLRPLLTILATRALGAQTSDVTDVACALEMVHAASLILDDLPCMDDAHTRRGQPAVHLAFGQDVAMLSAVALLACAWRTTVMAPDLSSAIRNDMAAELSSAVGLGGLVSGQYSDLHDGGDSLSPDATVRTNDRKTGALFAAAFELAGLAAGCSSDVRGLMRQAASEIGRAFQLADDLADVHTDAQTGDRTPTLVQLIGVSAAQAALSGHLTRAEQLLSAAMPADPSVVALLQHVFRRR